MPAILNECVDAQKQWIMFVLLNQFEYWFYDCRDSIQFEM